MSNCVECEKRADDPFGAVLCDDCAKAHAAGFRSACVIFAGLGLFVLALVLMRPAPDRSIELELDAAAALALRDCMNEGFAASVWTDGTQSRVTCAKPY